uniref:Protein FAM30C n=1 Tax=Elaeophora elaphi TaxID=1147741 RepID=A0A0R3S4Y5_9BILA
MVLIALILMVGIINITNSSLKLVFFSIEFWLYIINYDNRSRKKNDRISRPKLFRNKYILKNATRNKKRAKCDWLVKMEAESNEGETNQKIGGTQSDNEHMIASTSHFSRKSLPLRSSLMKRENRNRSSHAKFVSFSTQKNEKKICNVSDCIRMMQNATEFIKLRTNIRQFRRTFTLDSSLSHIHWTPTNKKPDKAKIAIESIKEVRIGRNTELHRATENYSDDLQVIR